MWFITTNVVPYKTQLRELSLCWKLHIFLCFFKVNGRGCQLAMYNYESLVCVVMHNIFQEFFVYTRDNVQHCNSEGSEQFLKLYT